VYVSEQWLVSRCCLVRDWPVCQQEVKRSNTHLQLESKSDIPRERERERERESKADRKREKEMEEALASTKDVDSLCKTDLSNLSTAINFVFCNLLYKMIHPFLEKASERE